MIQKEKIEKILEEYFLKRSDLFLVEIKISRDNDIEIVVEISLSGGVRKYQPFCRIQT